MTAIGAALLVAMAILSAPPESRTDGPPSDARARGLRVRSMTEGADPPGLDGKALRLFAGGWLSRWSRVAEPDRQGQRPAPEPVTLELGEGGELLLDGTYVSQFSIGDVQVHLEFRVPPQRDGSSVSYGELVLPQGCRLVMTDSMNRPQRDTSCGAILGIAAPTAAASLPPGAWQTFDVAYRAARRGPDGAISEPARVTLLHNGVMVQNAAALPAIADQPVEGPITLSRTFGTLHLRNLWVRSAQNPLVPQP